LLAGLKKEIKYKLDMLPREPGVYLFKDKTGKIIYIGKAKVLWNRVRSYFSGRDDGRFQFHLLVSNIADLETIVTDNEMEALILETTLIRKHRPRYNIEVRDNSTYPYLKVTKESFPRVFMTRQPKEDKAKYYGPLTDVKQAKDTLRALRKACQIRICNFKINDKSIKEEKHKICLEYHLGNCEGPCEGLVSQAEYNEGVQLIVDATHGRGSALISRLEERMQNYSKELKFEEAAKIRDQIKQTKAFATRQKVLSIDGTDKDIFGIVQQDKDACIVVISMREGRVVGRNHSFLKRIKGNVNDQIWSRYLVDYYMSETRYVPAEIVIPHHFADNEKELIIQFLEKKRDKKVKIILPLKGDKLKLLKLARHNADLLLNQKLEMRAKEERIPHALVTLQEHLKLDELPMTIECFDNSNLFGQFPVASMVRFKNARPEKSQYRHYKIKTVIGIDDFASMEEVVGRRYKRLLKENGDFPKLVLIDGGIGQVNAARRILDSLGLKDLPTVGLAKRFEEIVFPGSSETITLPKTSSALKLLMQIRDEAHRFAITFHRQLRNKAQVSSTLESLEGIGGSKAKALLKHFGSLKRVKAASAKQIAEVQGFSVKSGDELLQKLKDAEKVE